jgi:hypothetical protein
MGLFSRRKDPDKALAGAIARRGVRVRGEILAVSPEGDRHAITVRFAPEGKSARTLTVHQRFNAKTLVGIEPGQPVSLSYDRDDPAVVLIWGNPRYTTTKQGAVVRAVDVEGGEKG